MLAEELIGVHEKALTVRPFTERHPGLTAATGYLAARALHDHRLKNGWKPVGRKIGFTNRTLWERYRVREPMWGTVYDRTLIKADGDRATVPLEELVQPRIEPEIAFKLKAAPASADPKALLGCIEWMAHAVEIVQCHHPDWKFTIADCTTDNGLHGRLIVGTPVAVATVAGLAEKLPVVEARLYKGDRLMDKGVGANVLGSPLLALAHLVDLLRRQPGAPPLVPGEIVTTGVLTDAHPVVAGDEWHTQISGLPLPGLKILVPVRPLEGITVVALEQVIAGPFATRQLAELGARVIKIERPGGGDAARGYDQTVKGLSSHFAWTNRSKESLALDIKQEAAKEVLQRLLAKADVFLQNLAPGAAERLGLGAAELRTKHPRLVWCGISGYGPAGPYADKKAYDLLVQCEAGLLSVTGTPDAPSKAGIPVADIAAGMYAFSSILAALLRRERTGEGATLDITMFEALGEWMGFPALFTAYGGSAPPRSGAYHATIVPYGPFKAGDGGTVFLSVQNEREFARFCETVLRQPALARDARFSSSPARLKNGAAMHAEIDKVFSTLKTAEVIERLEAADIANARLNDMKQFWGHPQLAARARWAKVGSPAGELDMLKPPFNLSGFEPRMDAIPALGQHSEKILAELGYAEAEIRRLVALA